MYLLEQAKFLLLIGPLFLCAMPKLVVGSQFQVELNDSTACIESVKITGRGTKLPAQSGGFGVYDATSKKHIKFAGGTLQRDGEKTVFCCEQPGDLRLLAEFINKGPYVLVSGYVENLKQGERGILLDYCIPCAGKNALFCNELNSPAAVEDAEQEGNVYPIAAMCGGGLGLAMALPPSEPRIFGMVGSRRGLAARFYFGLSPETKNFPNRAGFVFVIYPVEPAWGFRSAVSRYYDFYPEYYTNRAPRDGWHLFLAEDGKEPPPPNLSYIAYDTLEMQAPWLQERLDRNVKNDIISLPYMIVGQRELKFLPTLPKSYAEAMQAYARWTPVYNVGHPGSKEIVAAGNDEKLRIEVDGCACEMADGERAIRIRNTLWGLNSVTFTMNPNPDLFCDTHDQSVGRNAIRRIEQWNKDHPELAGGTIDSLGAFFPALLNYRHDHFRYARYPLTCDPDGRPALHNMISHYEFLLGLQQQLRSQTDKPRYMGANGIYSYRAHTDPPEFYRVSTRNDRIRLGRFFLAAMLDFATSEPGIASDRRSVEFMRVAMGRKVYTPSNARWTDPVKVDQWFNQCLCYSFFAFNVRRYTDPILHYIPDGYQRDQKMIDWFMLNLRMIYRAGWEPVTFARPVGQNILLERYGSGSTIYFAVMSDNAADVDCQLKLELESLGLRPGCFTVEEVARQTPVQIAAVTITLKLKPNQTCIIVLKKTS